MILQLNPPLPLDSPKGWGWAHFVIDYGLEHSLYWVIFTESGQIWVLPNEQIRAMKNITAERPNPEKPKQ